MFIHRIEPMSFITSSDYVNDERLIEEINNAHTTWTAKKSERFKPNG